MQGIGKKCKSNWCKPTFFRKVLILTPFLIFQFKPSKKNSRSERLETVRGHNDQAKTPIDCSKRWRNLKKQKQADWSEKENDKLLNLVSTKGCNWSVFTKYFNNRTKDQLRKHYLKLKKNGRVPQIKSISCPNF